MENGRSDKLLLRAAYVARCEWCGTPHSPDWVVTDTGRMFCSSECRSAAYTGRSQVCGISVTAIMVAFLLIPDPMAVLLGLTILPIGLCVLAQWIEGRQHLSRKDKYRDTQLLVCGYCNHINASGGVVCEKCGASLADADFVSDPWPEWFAPLPAPRRARRYGPCKNCGKSFEFPILSADGKDRCPRCGNPVLHARR